MSALARATNRRTLGRGQAGSAAADFSLVAGLLALVFVALMGLGLSAYVRSALIDCASAAARHGALPGHDEHDAERRARELVAAALPGVALSKVSTSRVDHDGYRVVVVQVNAEAPWLALIGAGDLTARGRALEEPEP